mgnify:CR=1 FL=1
MQTNLIIRWEAAPAFIISPVMCRLSPTNTTTADTTSHTTTADTAATDTATTAAETVTVVVVRRRRREESMIQNFTQLQSLIRLLT